MQVHPGLRCNLACAHCYSASEPVARLEVDIDTLRRAVDDACQLGYRTMAVSGGEPLLYRDLAKLTAHAHAAGLTVTVTTNAMLVARRLESMLGTVDVWAVSVDGSPDTHNRMRGSPRAFDAMVAGLEALRRAGVSFGVVHTLVEAGLGEVVWVADFAVTMGAALLQIHPLELAGRAATMGAMHPAQATLGRAYLAALALGAAYGATMAVHIDLCPRVTLLAHPELVYAGDAAERDRAAGAGRLGNLAIESDGTIAPVAWGFSRRFALGDLSEERLAPSFQRWQRQGEEEFRALGRRVFAEVATNPQRRLLNIHELLVAASHDVPADQYAHHH